VVGQGRSPASSRRKTELVGDDWELPPLDWLDVEKENTTAELQSITWELGGPLATVAELDRS
jgi:hypothetical protein